MHLGSLTDGGATGLTGVVLVEVVVSTGLVVDKKPNVPHALLDFGGDELATSFAATEVGICILPLGGLLNV